MAAPTTATDLLDAFSVAYLNIHSIHEGSLGDGFRTRLIAWVDGFFSELDGSDPDQASVLHWAAVSLAQIDLIQLDTHLGENVGVLIRLLQDTIHSAVYGTFSLSPAQDTAMTAAFNAAWT